MTKTTYNGKTYEMGTEPAYPSKPGDVFYDAAGQLCFVNAEQCWWAANGIASPLKLPLYQAIEVKEPELVELWVDTPSLEITYTGCMATWLSKYQANIDKAVDRALKAEKVVITMPDGSTLEYYDPDGKFFKIKGREDNTVNAITITSLGERVEQALMAGRRAQIEEAG